MHHWMYKYIIKIDFNQYATTGCCHGNQKTNFLVSEKKYFSLGDLNLFTVVSV